MRLSRPCYNKFHRCPGWAGGGIHSAKVQRCEGGSLAADVHLYDGRWKWRFNQCPRCRVIILPSVIRYLDPGWWKWQKDKPVKLLAKIRLKVNYLIDYIPGFSDAYDDEYDDFTRKEYSKIIQDNKEE